MAKHGVVNHCDTISSWNQIMKEASLESKIVVVDCSAKWCGPCHYMEPCFNDLSSKYHHILFIRIDIDQMKDVVYDMDIQGFPTFLVMKNGKEVDRILGANKEELQKRVFLYA
ncbi:hypothetical protein L7F22_040575 [Adiantum nelumboides]|nr:hypothetical protein [Adiantum nelumboides]